MHRIEQENEDAFTGMLQFAGSGANPYGYYISAKTLSEQIHQASGVTQKFKKKLVSILGLDSVKETDLVDSFQLGGIFVRVSSILSHNELHLLERVHRHIRKIENVPIVNIRGETVN